MDILSSFYVQQPLVIAAVAAVHFAAAARWRSRERLRHDASNACFLAGGVWLLASAWEFLVMMESPEANIRVDLLLLWPVLLLVSGRALWKAWRSTRTTRGSASLLLIVAACVPAWTAEAEAEAAQQERVRGTSVEFRSPNAVVERCVALAPIPGGVYSEQDRATERSYCGIDFSAPEIALCPKTWSTSPATVVYELSPGTDAERFEREHCGRGGHARAAAKAELAFYKTSMNASDTSGTFAPAALAYYHLSRHFDTRVRVPVAVYRSMDRKAHRTRVSEPGLRYTSGPSSLRMIHAGWKHLTDAEAAPSEYLHREELFTSDGDRIFGVLLSETGERYGAELNGTRASGWGNGQNYDFQHTAPFLALRHAAPLRDAIAAGIHDARRDPAMKRALRDQPTPEQMAFWMQEVSEIALLDYIFRQQDRIGNIDYEPRWHWIEDGKVESRPAESDTPPREIASASPVRLRRTWLNDNDAGVRATYTNFAERTGMLEGLRHFNADLYLKLQRLAVDLASEGPVSAYLRDVMGLTDRQRSAIAERTAKAAAILRSSCESGELRFDLEPEALLAGRNPTPRKLDCKIPDAAG